MECSCDCNLFLDAQVLFFLLSGDHKSFSVWTDSLRMVSS
uniref:Uncharacterized protein n=1 Tax=Anguilla anguilla TaxID=7936 RepID=A0A0E9QN77_ANGAN